MPFSPPGILPVGYPVFITSNPAAGSADYPETAEELSPLTALPDPAEAANFSSNQGANFPAPLRQSPASALPPFINFIDEEKKNTTNQFFPETDITTTTTTHHAPRVFNDPLEMIEHDIKNSDIIQFHQEEHQSTSKHINQFCAIIYELILCSILKLKNSFLGFFIGRAPFDISLFIIMSNNFKKCLVII